MFQNPLVVHLSQLVDEVASQPVAERLYDEDGADKQVPAEETRRKVGCRDLGIEIHRC